MSTKARDNAKLAKTSSVVESLKRTSEAGIAACPAAVLELIAEVERLRAAQTNSSSNFSSNCAAPAAGTVEKDAERYRWLRDKSNDERSRAPMVFNCHPEDVIQWSDSLHGANLDAVLDVFVDAAIEAHNARSPSCGP